MIVALSDPEEGWNRTSEISNGVVVLTVRGHDVYSQEFMNQRV